jgi:8-oxo-dGTP diphosphatase
MGNRRIEVRAVAVVIGGPCVLLVQSKHSPEAWVPPGGKLEPDELLPDAVAREVWEETGVRVAVDALIACRQAWWEDRDALEMYFAARPLPGSDQAGSGPEGRPARFFPLCDLPRTCHFPESLDSLCVLATEALARGGVPCVLLPPLDMRP